MPGHFNASAISVYQALEGPIHLNVVSHDPYDTHMIAHTTEATNITFSTILQCLN